MRRKVKITGVGPVTPAGNGREMFWRGINEPVSRVHEITRFNVEAGPFVGAEVQGFRLNDFVETIGGKRLPRHTQFALASVALAMADAGIKMIELNGSDPLVVTGSSLMDADLTNRTIEAVLTKGPRAALPSVVFEAVPSAIGGRIAGQLKTGCRTMAIQTACCAGLDAIGHGYEMVATGQADVAICCGTEAPLYFHPQLELKMAGLAPGNARKPQEMGRPFDMWRNSGVIGEGASAVILEPESSPRAAYAWIAGYAYGGDDPGDLAGNGLRKTMRMALANASRRAEEVDAIFAWGPGHEIIDRAEAEALCAVFGSRIAYIPAGSLKGAIGTALAASGAMQVVSAAMALRTGRMPPTVNWVTPDPVCPLNLGRETREIGFNHVVVNAHGLSGTNSTMILSRA